MRNTFQKALSFRVLLMLGVSTVLVFARPFRSPEESSMSDSTATDSLDLNSTFQAVSNSSNNHFSPRHARAAKVINAMATFGPPDAPGDSDDEELWTHLGVRTLVDCARKKYDKENKFSELTVTYPTKQWNPVKVAQQQDYHHFNVELKGWPWGPWKYMGLLKWVDRKKENGMISGKITGQLQYYSADGKLRVYLELSDKSVQFTERSQ